MSLNCKLEYDLSIATLNAAIETHLLTSFGRLFHFLVHDIKARLRFLKFVLGFGISNWRVLFLKPYRLTMCGGRFPFTIDEFGISFAHASVRGHSTKQAFSAAELASE